MKRYFLAALAVGLMVTNALAVDIVDNVKLNGSGEPIPFVNSYNFDRCLQYDRSRNRVEKISDRECVGLKAIYARRAEEAEKARLKKEQAAQAYEARSKLQREDEEARAAIQQERMRQSREQQVEAEETRRKEFAELDRRDRAVAAKSAEAESLKKSICGLDYKNPQIGMSLGRWKECVGPLRMTGQINRADGIANLYNGPGIWTNVMGDKVVAWGK